MRKYLAVVLVACAVLTFFGCSKKVKPDTQMDNLMAIQDKDMTFDAEGSDSGKIMGLTTVHFDYDKSNLNSEARNGIVKNSEWLKKNPNRGIQIEGHCDRHGSTEYNLALGERRAKAVQKYLVNLGIKPSRITTISYGKKKMLNNAETDEADFQNRRANFKPFESTKINPVSQR